MQIKPVLVSYKSREFLPLELELSNYANRRCGVGVGVGAGAGAAGAGTLRPGPEPEPSEHSVLNRSWSRQKMFRLRLRKISCTLAHSADE